ncbi:MAG: FmdE family protein [Thermoplasmatota archaeon]
MAGPLDLKEQIDLLKGLDIGERDRKVMEKASRFHGHICPGLATGVAASLEFLDDRERASDEELVAVVENDACGVDGIQAVLGCTFGKGNLIFWDHGKSVYTFYSRESGTGKRYSVRDLPEGDPDEKGLISRVRSEEATPEEEERFRRLWVKKAGEILRNRRVLFEVEEAEEEVPEKARLFDSFICPRCGERTGSHRAVEIDDERYCIPCSEKVVQ